ncbi:MAG: hypothetical protein HY650_08460 [Acidobacteria bacterium]|nr:hypothetical protein [Acidobacteriota bacterium]
MGDRIQQIREALPDTMDEEFPSWRCTRRRAIHLGVVLISAGLVLSLALLAYGWIQRREADRQRAMRGRTIELIDPLERIGSGPVTFVWRPSIISATYTVELLDADYRVIWSNPSTSEVEAGLPPEIRAGLRMGQIHYWQVRGFDLESREVSRSDLQELRLDR